MEGRARQTEGRSSERVRRLEGGCVGLHALLLGGHDVLPCGRQAQGDLLLRAEGRAGAAHGTALVKFKNEIA